MLSTLELALGSQSRQQSQAPKGNWSQCGDWNPGGPRSQPWDHSRSHRGQSQHRATPSHRIHLPGLGGCTTCSLWPAPAPGSPGHVSPAAARKEARKLSKAPRGGESVGQGGTRPSSSSCMRPWNSPKDPRPWSSYRHRVQGQHRSQAGALGQRSLHPAQILQVRAPAPSSSPLPCPHVSVLLCIPLPALPIPGTLARAWSEL